jgi:uncharacterized protein YkwD
MLPLTCRLTLCFAILLVSRLAAEETRDAKSDLSADEQALLDLTNESRAKANLPPLRANPQLLTAARAHAANMAKKGEMAHELDGKTPSDRVKEAGYGARRVGENVAVGERLKPADVVKLWMESPRHKENILHDEYTEIGLGLAKNEKGETYYAQVFAAPKRAR